MRSIRSDDTEKIFTCWMNDENVSRYMQWKASDDINEARSFVEFELKNTENDTWNRWLIVNRATNELMGTCLLFFNEIDGDWDISYNLGKRFWGNGYATEAMRAVIKYAAEAMAIKTICTTYALENKASERVLWKLGFSFGEEVTYECNGGNIITRGRRCELMCGEDKLKTK